MSGPAKQAPWLEPAAGAQSPLEGVLRWTPDLLDAFKAYYFSFWKESLLPADILEMLRIRIAQIHGCTSELAIRYPGAELDDGRRTALAKWRDADCFSEKERVLLAYAEKIPFEHHFISDEEAAAVREHLSDPEFVAFTVALSLFDALARLRLAFALIANNAPGDVDAPLAGAETLY